MEFTPDAPGPEKSLNEGELREELARIMARSDELMAEQERLSVRMAEILRLLRVPAKESLRDW
jgi:hypothetical protein